MPHPIDEGSDQKFVHKEGFQKKQLKKATCYNCHAPKFCNDCHHPAGAKSGKPWVRYHPTVVKKDGAAACLESCHKETFCSDCHVNRAQDIIKATSPEHTVRNARSPAPKGVGLLSFRS